MKRYLGIDFGAARVGIARSDLLGYTAQGTETITWNGHNLEPVLDRIVELCKEYSVDEFVIGLPLRTDNKAGEAEQKVREFAATLHERIDLPQHFYDERLTSKMATRYLQAGGSKKSSYRSKIDQVAAEIILQSFLDRERFQKERDAREDNV